MIRRALRGLTGAAARTCQAARQQQPACHVSAVAHPAHVATPERVFSAGAGRGAARRAAVLGAGTTHGWVAGTVKGAAAARFGGAGLSRSLPGGRRGIFIQTQTTPNPASLMFMPGKPVYEDGGSKNFANMREAMASPLAKKLFNIEGVTSVFFGSEFVTVTKSEAHEWGVLKPEVFAAIMDFYASGEAIITDEAVMAASGTAITEDDDEIVAMIKELLETRIRPAVAEDGGDILFKAWDSDTGVVTVKMQGACDGCPSSSVTLKSGIENMLRHYVPEVTSVQQEEEEGSMDLLDMATQGR